MGKGGIKAFNERYARVRVLVEGSGVKLARADIDLISRQVARYLPAIEDSGVDLRVLINNIIDSYDSTLSRGEKKALVEDVIKRFINVDDEPLEDKAELLQQKSDIERGIEELKEMLEAANAIEEKEAIIENLVGLVDDLREINNKLLDAERLELEREYRVKMRNMARRRKPKVVERKVIVYTAQGKKETKEVKEERERETPKAPKAPNVYEMLMSMPRVQYMRPRRRYRASRVSRLLVELVSTAIAIGILGVVVLGGLTLMIKLLVP